MGFFLLSTSGILEWFPWTRLTLSTKWSKTNFLNKKVDHGSHYWFVLWYLLKHWKHRSSWLSLPFFLSVSVYLYIEAGLLGRRKKGLVEGGRQESVMKDEDAYFKKTKWCKRTWKYCDDWNSSFYLMNIC